MKMKTKPIFLFVTLNEQKYIIAMNIMTFIT